MTPIKIDAQNTILCSAKNGTGIDEALEAIIQRVPNPSGDPNKPLKAIIIDAWFDNYVGVVMLVRVVDGQIQPKDKIHLMATSAEFICEQVGIFTPKALNKKSLNTGEVGFIICGIKELDNAKVGDTVTLAKNKASEAFPDFKEVKPQVFAGLYPIESNQFEALRTALEKLRKSAGLTQQQLSNSAEVSRKSINAIENGIYVPSTVLALKIAKTLNCKVEDLFKLPQKLPK